MFPIINIISPKSILVLKNILYFFKMKIFLLITKTVYIYLENFSSINNYKK